MALKKRRAKRSRNSSGSKKRRAKRQRRVAERSTMRFLLHRNRRRHDSQVLALPAKKSCPSRLYRKAKAMRGCWIAAAGGAKSGPETMRFRPGSSFIMELLKMYSGMFGRASARRRHGFGGAFLPPLAIFHRYKGSGTLRQTTERRREKDRKIHAIVCIGRAARAFRGCRAATATTEASIKKTKNMAARRRARKSFTYFCRLNNQHTLYIANRNTVSWQRI